MRSALPTLQIDPALARRGAVLDVARAILEGFDKHYRLFREITRTAQKHFEEADWIAIQRATRERIRFYDLRVREAVEHLKQEFQADSLDDTIWQRVKVQYIGLLADHKQPECAETFFNSVCCKILQRTYFHNNFIFVRPAVSTEHIDSDPPSYRCYYPRKSGLHETLVRILDDFGLKRPFADLNRDLRYVIHAWQQYLPNAFAVEANHQIQVLGSLFFRNKAAYLVGKIINGNHDYPFVVPILHDPDGRLYLDTVLVDPDQLAILFSSSRAYFLVDMEVPSAYVQFLCGMLPNKPKAELYTILGLQKQGKTLFYRDFLHHLKNSSDEFIIAPGIKGLVMLVFTLPSYPYVFKVIKDVIAPPKHVTREKVKEKYLLVKYHDRVGRMADTLEYSDVAFPKARFTAELLTELRTLAPSVIEDEGETLIVKHLYIERRMIPLNIYLERADDKQRAHAVREVGTAIKQLAAANIFPGDLLFKNFGMTRHDRVIFYDYDEIDYLTNCKFRQMPSPRHEEDELSAEPWFSVDPHDVFPEEFATFLLVNPQVREHFLEYHGDILTAQFWQAIQQRIAAGNIEDVFPYPEPLRFCNSFRATDL